MYAKNIIKLKEKIERNDSSKRSFRWPAEGSRCGEMALAVGFSLDWCLDAYTFSSSAFPYQLTFPSPVLSQVHCPEIWGLLNSVASSFLVL